MEGTGEAKAFAHRLRKLMGERKLSVRAFGKMVDPDDPERGRRRVQRHLGGVILPTSSSRDSYAKALGVPRSDLPLPSDEASEDLADLLLATVREYRALGTRLDRLGHAIEALS